MKKLTTLFGALLAVLALSSAAYACDGYMRVEKKFKHFNKVDLTAGQKKKIDSLKVLARKAFSDDHTHGRCDAQHEKTIAKYTTQAHNGVLTNAQRMNLKTNEKIASLEKQIAALKREMTELKRLIKELAARK